MWKQKKPIQEKTIGIFECHLHKNGNDGHDPGYFDIIEWSGIVYREYSRGPNTLPCGTPYCNKTGLDFDARVITVWDLSDRKEDNKLRAVDDISNQCCKGWVKILWPMLSKAADRSNSRRAVECAASSEARMSFWTYNRAVSEEWNLRWADCNLDIRLWDERYEERQEAITCPINFDKKDIFKIGR